MSDGFRSHSWDFLTVLSTLHSVYDVDVLFRGWLGPDDKNPEQDMLQVNRTYGGRVHGTVTVSYVVVECMEL